MDKKLVKAINEQIKNELYSSYLYLSMAAYFESKNLPGFGHWMRVQAKEENEHGMKMFDFLADRGERIALEAISQPPSDFSSAQEVFEETLKHEKKVTALINQLYDIASKVDDKASQIFLQWFITEQIEEEKNANSILETIKSIKSYSAALIMLDRELAKRGK
ncbi:MAG: ferritin [Candidatus Omnitrophica bacterium]|nr:ferritin [Candidatus Omnitrophota bacterium]